MRRARPSLSLSAILLFLLSFHSGNSSHTKANAKTPQPFNVKQLGTGEETAAAVVPTDAKNPNYVIAWIGKGGAKWAVSSDQGSNWNIHSVTEPDFDWGPPVGTQGSWSYQDDPTLVTTGHPNQVAYTLIATDRSDRTDEVGIAVSTDGGAHFGKVRLVSQPEDGPGDDPEPSAALNAATGQIWVAWTQKPGPRLMIRALHYNDAGDLTFDTDPIDLSGLPGLKNINSNRDDVNVTVTAGNYGGLSHVAIAYADRYDPYDGGTKCPGTLDVTYYIADSTDSGRSWKSTKIVRDPVWPQCVTDAPMFNRNRPAIALAADGRGLNYYVALTQSSPTGSLVHLYRVEWPFVEGTVHDLGKIPPPDGRVHDQFGPAIAVGYSSANASDPKRTAANVMVTWHDTRADGTGNKRDLIYGSVWGSNATNIWQGVVSPAVGMSNEHVPWEMTGRRGDLFWGDYEAIAADDVNHTFISAWGDNRVDGDVSVWTSVLNPTGRN